MIVLDASAAVEWLLRTTAGLRVEARVFESPEDIHAPHLLDLEVAQALRRLVAARQLHAARAAEAIADLGELALFRHAHDPLLARIWELRNSVTAYDAAYLALSESLDAPLVTCDGKLGRSRGHDAEVEVVP